MTLKTINKARYDTFAAVITVLQDLEHIKRQRPYSVAVHPKMLSEFLDKGMGDLGVVVGEPLVKAYEEALLLLTGVNEAFDARMKAARADVIRARTLFIRDYFTDLVTDTSPDGTVELHYTSLFGQTTIKATVVELNLNGYHEKTNSIFGHIQFKTSDSEFAAGLEITPAGTWTISYPNELKNGYGGIGASPFTDEPGSAWVYTSTVVQSHQRMRDHNAARSAELAMENAGAIRTSDASMQQATGAVSGGGEGRLRVEDMPW